MPTAFQYIRNSTGQAVDIAEMDGIICTAIGWVVHPTDALGFDFLAYTGIAILSQGEGYFETTKEIVDLYINKKREEYKDLSKELAEFLRWETYWRRFFYEEFTFKAWWEPKA